MNTDHWDWPEELDALLAAPGNHRLMVENDHVRVLETTIPVGASTPVHTHRRPSVEYILDATNFVRRNAEGHVLLDTRAGMPSHGWPTCSGPSRSRLTRSRTSAKQSSA